MTMCIAVFLLRIRRKINKTFEYISFNFNFSYLGASQLFWCPRFVFDRPNHSMKVYIFVFLNVVFFSVVVLGLRRPFLTDSEREQNILGNFQKKYIFVFSKLLLVFSDFRQHGRSFYLNK